MLLIPAIDLKDGKCVRLERGEVESAVRPERRDERRDDAAESHRPQAAGVFFASACATLPRRWTGRFPKSPAAPKR